MIPDRYELADVDGTLCIKWTTTDYMEPRIIINYWPTVVRTMDALDFFLDSRDMADVAKLECRQTRPGEYFVGVKNGPEIWSTWKTGKHISLLHGGATQSIKTETREAPAPKVRKGIMLYWSGGNWVKHLKKGTEKINPLEV